MTLARPAQASKSDRRRTAAAQSLRIQRQRLRKLAALGAAVDRRARPPDPPAGAVSDPGSIPDRVLSAPGGVELPRS